MFDDDVAGRVGHQRTVGRTADPAGVVGQRKGSSQQKTKALWFSLALQLPVAIYGAFFGAGIGILMLASFGFMGMTHIHEMNALMIETWFGVMPNVAAAAAMYLPIGRLMYSEYSGAPLRDF